MAMTFKWTGDAWAKAAVPAAEKGLEEVAKFCAEKARVSIGRNHGGVASQPGMPPNSQTGNLRRRIAWVGAAQVGRLRAAFGTDVKYGRYLEFGARPRARDKYLTVPLTVQAAKALRRVKTVRAIPGLKWHPPRKGNTRSGGVLGKIVSKKFVAWFALMTDVTIKARPWLRPAFFNNSHEAGQIFARVAVRELLRHAKAGGVA